ncbi:MAG: SGNH/GDSL hydrolase family protein [Candidatus Thiodiazotropha sp. (ex Dulcina madagascariensis)]|nr:SGNH/GDSL hydrolase family protein [Candidatus Thiodiazotropha sp. (ex Dulcina madagascariensis)]
MEAKRSWSSLAQRAFDAEGIDVDIFHTGTGGLTYYRAMNMVDPEIGQTYVQLTNSLNLDIIIVELGLNDAMQNGDGRTQAQVIADAQAVYAALRAGSPDAVIIYSRLVPYDEDQHGAKAVTAIKKKYCVPYMHSTSTMPGESGLYTSEEAELEKIIDPVMQGRLTDWRVLDATCQGFADVVVHSNYFKPARLGLVSYDRLHGTSLGYFFILSEMWKAFKTDTALRTQIPELTKIRYLGDFTDLSITWESAVKPDVVGDGYVIDPDWVDGFEYPMWLNVRDHSKIASYPEYWSNQQRPSISISDRVVRANGEAFAVMITNAWPDQPVSTKIWAVGSAEPSTFAVYTPAKYTSGTGDLIEAYIPSSADKPSGDYLIKYKIGNDVFGPFPVAISGAYPSSGGVAVAVFKNVTAPNATAAGMWKNVIVDTTDFNEAPSVITLEPGSGRIDIAYGAGYTYFKVTGYATIRSNGAGHYGLSYSRNGVAQHDRGCANLAYTPSVGSFAPLSFSTEWIPIGVAGEYVSLQALGPAVSYITQTYGTFIQIELR